MVMLLKNALQYCGTTIPVLLSIFMSTIVHNQTGCVNKATYVRLAAMCACSKLGAWITERGELD